jgi:alanyl-tRNA synthetase
MDKKVFHMETEKLYYSDPYLREFTARVLSCEAAGGGYSVVLDRTAFYPEGGGQPCDTGTLNGVPVTDVHERDGVVFHTCPQKVEIGAAVIGTLDWERRFDHMQQHSGEHILSGILCDTYHCSNVGFHLGNETVTIDYDADISWEGALAAEAAANAVIEADAPVEIAYPSPQALSDLTYRSKKELTGRVRIVTFPGADCCACCGTHVLRAGQVGLVKVLSVQNFRTGVRLEIVSGRRALRLLGAIYEQNRQVSQLLSVKPENTKNAVVRLQNQLAEEKFRADRLEDSANLALAREYAGRGDVLLLRPAMSSDAVRRLADAVAKTCGGLAAVFAGEGAQPQHAAEFRYALVRADGGDIAPLVKAMNAALCGRGGGRSGFAQGSAQTRRAEIEFFFAQRGISAPAEKN